MRLSRLIRMALLLVAAGSVAGCSTTPLNKQEAADFNETYSSMIRWVGYQGSDAQSHHFIARVMDSWRFIQIERDQLKMSDERPYRAASNAPLYYYLVDLNENYRKIVGTEQVR